MSNDSAKDLVRSILHETERRKRIWRLMRAAGREATNAVVAHARSRGVTTLDWFGDFGGEATRVGVYYQTGGARSPIKSFLLCRDGRVVRKRLSGDELYEDYPNLTNKDPAAFKRAAVERLMEQFNCYMQQQHRKRRSGHDRRRKP